MVQILHFFLGQRLNNKYEVADDFQLKKLLLDEQQNLVKNNSRVNINSITTSGDLWRFGGFFYNLKYIKILELKNFLLYFGANEVMLVDLIFLKNLQFFFSLFKNEAFILFFFKYISVYELYYLLSSQKLNFFFYKSLIEQFNYKMMQLYKINFLKKLWFSMRVNKTSISYLQSNSLISSNDFFFFV